MINDKRGYDDSKKANEAIPKKDAKKKLHSMRADRDTQDIDLKPEKIFEDGEDFNGRKFNAAFDIQKKQTTDSDMILSNGVPSAWNDLGTVANFSNFDDLDNVFVEDSNRFDTSRQMYDSVNFGSAPSVKLTKDFVANLNGGDYYDNHSTLDDDYYEDMKKQLSKRQSSQETFDKMKFNDYKRDDTAGYGIFDQLGFKFDDRLTLDLDDDDISARFEKILADRQKL